MTDQEQIRSQEIAVAKWMGYTLLYKPKKVMSEPNRWALIHPSGQQQDFCVVGEETHDEAWAWVQLAPYYSLLWQAFGSLLTVLAERGYSYAVDGALKGVAVEIFVDEGRGRSFASVAKTLPLALLAATTKLIESVSSNQETAS